VSIAVAEEKMELNEEAISEILVADTDSESGSEAILKTILRRRRTRKRRGRRRGG
jgi:hypothetical protein